MLLECIPCEKEKTAVAYSSLNFKCQIKNNLLNGIKKQSLIKSYLLSQNLRQVKLRENFKSLSPRLFLLIQKKQVFKNEPQF